MFKEDFIDDFFFKINNDTNIDSDIWGQSFAALLGGAVAPLATQPLQ